jgi:hypothetical protein
MTDPISMVWHDLPIARIMEPLERMHAALVSEDEHEHPYVHHLAGADKPHETPGFYCEISGSSRPLSIGMPLGPIGPDEKDGGFARAAAAIASLMEALRTLEPYTGSRMGERHDQWQIAGLMAAGPPPRPWAVHLPTPWTPLIIEAENEGRIPIPTDVDPAFNANAPKGVCLICGENGRGDEIVSVTMHPIGAWIGSDNNEVDPCNDPIATMRAVDAAIARGAIAR